MLSYILSYPHDARSALCVVSSFAAIFVIQNAVLVGDSDEKGTSQPLIWGVFLRLLAVVFGIAFASLSVQIKALIGRNGIQPVEVFTMRAKYLYGWYRFIRFPSLLHLHPSDWMLSLLTKGGVALAVLAALGIQSQLCFVLMWVFYLSLVTCGGDFIFFPWDFFLLESGFLAIFLPPLEALVHSLSTQYPPLHIIVWAYKFLLFRLMLGFGIEKFWCPRDTQTKTCTYIKYFLFWQPMPSPAAWRLHQLPMYIHKLSLNCLFVTEIVMPFLIFMPYPLPYFSALSFLLLQIGIQLCGNYGIFNVLTATVSITLLDSYSTLRQALIPSYFGGQLSVSNIGIYFMVFLLSATGSFFIIRQLQPGGVIWANYPAWMFSEKAKFWGKRIPKGVLKVFRVLASFHLVHGWGVFRGSIIPLLTIEIAASVDMIHWKKLEFWYYHKPSWFAPHQPRLDHLMFYESCNFRFSHSSVNGVNDIWPSKGPDCYFSRFLKKYCEGDETICGMLMKDPFGSGGSTRGEEEEKQTDEYSKREDIVCVRVNHYLDSKFSKWTHLQALMQEEEEEGTPEEERTKFDYWNDEGLVLREIYEWDKNTGTLSETDWATLRIKLERQNPNRPDAQFSNFMSWPREDTYRGKKAKIVEIDKKKKKKKKKNKKNKNESEEDEKNKKKKKKKSKSKKEKKKKKKVKSQKEEEEEGDKEEMDKINT